jgi:hypothetical protein
MHLATCTWPALPALACFTAQHHSLTSSAPAAPPPQVYASKAQPPSPTNHTMPSGGQPMRFTAKHTADSAVSPRSRGVSMSMPGTGGAPNFRGPAPRARQDTDGASVATEALFPQASQGLRPLQVPRTGFNRPQGGYTTAVSCAATLL